MGGVPPQHESWTDAELMAAIGELDDVAFRTLYRRHAAAAFALARYIVRSDAGPDDVVQDAFLSVWRSGGRYDPSRGSVRTWVLSIVRHRALDARRRVASRHEAQADVEDFSGTLVASDPLPEAQLLVGEHANAVRRALPQLPADQRAVVDLAFYRGLSHTEIAQRLQLPLGTVKSRMRLALLKLREGLDGIEARP